MKGNFMENVLVPARRLLTSYLRWYGRHRICMGSKWVARHCQGKLEHTYHQNDLSVSSTQGKKSLFCPRNRKFKAIFSKVQTRYFSFRKKRNHVSHFTWKGEQIKIGFISAWSKLPNTFLQTSLPQKGKQQKSGKLCPRVLLDLPPHCLDQLSVNKYCLLFLFCFIGV